MPVVILRLIDFLVWNRIPAPFETCSGCSDSHNFVYTPPASLSLSTDHQIASTWTRAMPRLPASTAAAFWNIAPRAGVRCLTPGHGGRAPLPSARFSLVAVIRSSGISNKGLRTSKLKRCVEIGCIKGVAKEDIKCFTGNAPVLRPARQCQPERLCRANQGQSECSAVRRPSRLQICLQSCRRKARSTV